MVLYFGNISTKYQIPGFSCFGKTCLVVWMVLGSGSLPAQPIHFTSAYNSGMLSSDRFSPEYESPVLQPSLLPEVSSPVISTHIQSRFSGFGIYALGLHLASPLQDGFGIGLSVLSIGHPDYHSTNILLSAGKKLSEYWGIGISQRLNGRRVGDEGRPWGGSSSIAASFNRSQWGLALTLSGLMPWNRSGLSEIFSAQLASYITWETRTQLYLLAAYSENELVPVVGIRQSIMHNVDVFGAFRLYPARYGLGFSLPLAKTLKSTISTRYHPVLGWSPSVGIRWNGN